jgi:nitrate/TMAO reductase-like tetraheme cytochrome c subunit
MRGRLAQLAALGVVIAAVGWLFTDFLESHDEFCTSCHLNGKPLHEAKQRDFETLPAANLASAHLAHDREFRCITCHRGVSFPNRVRVKLLAARDALVYLTGRFDEPRSMAHPLWREDCVQCHEKYDPKRGDAFHAIAVHNLPKFALNCVQCHEAHPTGRPADQAFLAREPLVAECRNCHEEF